MTKFRDLPIRRQLFRLTLATSVTALLLADAGFLVWDITRFRADASQDLNAQAEIVAENSAAPLAFGDNGAAGETLAVLRLRPRVTTACLYTTAPVLFATYHRDGRGECPAAPPAATRYGWDVFDAVVPVVAGTDHYGTLYIRRELGDLYERIQLAGAASLALLLIAFTAAFLIARRMEHSIAAPLLGLADTARTISSTREYSLRAPAAAGEIGVVVRSFNEMLDRLGEQEADRAGALERERQANRLKDEFLATLSHELRTPLNAVLGWTRVLQTTGNEAAKQARALDSIERNARAQAKLIEDLLDISRIVTGKLQLSVRPVDLAAIVDAAIDVGQPAAAAKGILVAAEIDARPAMTLGDPDRLQQVVWNLLSNAIKFTPPGGDITVRLRGGDGYRLTVRDSGRGIEPAFLPHVFESFRQADASASREHGGLGLGLAIAKQLVELHGGTIRADSPGAGGGATFEVMLPSAVRGAERPARPAERADTAAAPDTLFLRNVRVLVVDDDPDARALLELALRQYGAEVATAESAAAGMAAIERETPDVLLSDIGMPGEDGYSFIQRVRARAAGAGGAVPAIAITAYASAADRDAALAAGYQAHFSKPLNTDAVAAFVATLTRS